MMSPTKSVSDTTETLPRLSFTPAETCVLINCSRMSLWRLEQRGLLVPVRHLRHPVYSRAAIDRYLAGEAPATTRKAS